MAVAGSPLPAGVIKKKTCGDVISRPYCVCIAFVFTQETTFWPNNQDFPLIFTSFCVLLGTKTAALRRLYGTAGLSEFLQFHRRADLKVMIHRGGDYLEQLLGTLPYLVKDFHTVRHSPKHIAVESVIL